MRVQSDAETTSLMNAEARHRVGQGGGSSGQENTVLPDAYAVIVRRYLEFSVPYMMSRALIALPWFCDGLVLKQLGSAAISAGPVIIALKACVMGLGGGFMIPTGFLASPHVERSLEFQDEIKLIKQGIIAEMMQPFQASMGQVQLSETVAMEAAKNILKSSKIQQDMQRCTKKQSDLMRHAEAVGIISRQACLIAAVYSVIIGVLLVNFKNMFHASNDSVEDQAIVEAIQGYLFFYLWSLPANLVLRSDKKIVLALKKSKVVLASTVLNTAMTMGIGYGLALKSDLGIKGLGLGACISAWVNAALLRCYLSTELFRPFCLYSGRLRSSEASFMHYFKHGTKLGLFSLSEWGNLMLIVVLAANQNNLEVIQPSLQFIIPTSFVFLGFSQTAGIVIGHNHGSLRHALDQGNTDQAKNIIENIRRLGMVNTLVACMATAILSVGFLSCARPFVRALTGKTLPEAESLLYINGAAVVVDSVRAANSGNLSGFADTLFAAVVSFGALTVLGFSVTAGIIYGLNIDSSVWLFLPRLFGLVVAAVAIQYRFRQKSSERQQLIFQTSDEVEMIQPQQSDRSYNTFFPSPAAMEEELIEEVNKRICVSDRC